MKDTDIWSIASPTPILKFRTITVNNELHYTNRLSYNFDWFSLPLVMATLQCNIKLESAIKAPVAGVSNIRSDAA